MQPGSTRRRTSPPSTPHAFSGHVEQPKKTRPPRVGTDFGPDAYVTLWVIE